MKTGIFIGKNKHSAKCIKIIDGRINNFILSHIKEEIEWEYPNQKVFFFVCSDRQQIGSSILK
jgi:hypothetical protein